MSARVGPDMLPKCLDTAPHFAYRAFTQTGGFRSPIDGFCAARPPKDFLGPLGVLVFVALGRWGRYQGGDSMEIGPNTIVTMDYTLRLDSGEVVDSSEGNDPLVFQFGRGQIIPGLERELAGLKMGDQKEVRVAPEEAYGSRQLRGVHQIPLDRFPKDITPAVGMRLTVRGPQGEEVPFTIAAIADGQATLDFNHPLAGETLTFSVMVRDVRPALEGRIILPGEE